jgi:hypothetical protein
MPRRARRSLGTCRRRPPRPAASPPRGGRADATWSSTRWALHALRLKPRRDSTARLPLRQGGWSADHPPLSPTSAASSPTARPSWPPILSWRPPRPAAPTADERVRAGGYPRPYPPGCPKSIRTVSLGALQCLPHRARLIPHEGNPALGPPGESGGLRGPARGAEADTHSDGPSSDPSVDPPTGGRTERSPVRTSYPARMKVLLSGGLYGAPR